MKKRFFNVYLFIVLLISVTMYFGVMRAYNTVDDHSNELIFLEYFYLDGEYTALHEQKISAGEEGIFEYYTYIDKKDIENIDGDALLVIPRLRGSWHKIYFNSELIGVIGAEGETRHHSWNAVNKFLIPENKFKTQNILSFETYSSYKIGYGDFPLFIGDAFIGNKIFNALTMMYSNFYLVIIGMLFALAVMEMLLFFLTKTFERKYMFFPISIILIGIYLLDYTVISHAWFSELVFKKVMIFSLYMSPVVMSFALVRIYSSQVIKYLSYFVLVVSSMVIIFSKTMVELSFLYNRLNFILLLLIGSWIVVAFRHYQLSKRSQDYMIAFAGLLLLIPSMLDTIFLMFYDGRYTRISVYGFVYYAIAMLLIAIVNYIENQKNVYSEGRIFEMESERLKKALVTDELTGLYNHRQFYDVFSKVIDVHHDKVYIIMLDIDRFRPINDILGHKVGDAILKEIANILSEHAHDKGHIFRYGGEEFVILYKSEEPSPLEIADNIRFSVLESKILHDLSGYLPITLSIGIAMCPKDGKVARTLINKAEKAISFAKLSGRNKVCLYTSDIEAKLEGNEAIELKDELLVNFIYTLASLIDMKDKYTGLHSEEVSRYAMLIAEEMSLDDHQKYALRLGGLLHDFGKLSVPDTIVTKKGTLSVEEFDLIKSHPKTGFDIVKQIIDDADVIDCVRSHHERYDGKGYPDGLSGENIPFLGRVTCVADAYHAMISTRSYREGLGHDVAMKELISNKGTQFDPDIVDAFVNVFKK